MKFAIKSDVGQRRKVNEDAAGYFESKNNIPLMMVCDGIGGHNAGEIASAMALMSIGQAWEKTEFNDIEEVYQWLIKKITEANEAIFTRSAQYEDLYGMGTTVVVASIIGNQLMIANVGDSRAYVLRNFQLKQLTEDQSLVNALLKSGEITPEGIKDLVLTLTVTEKEDANNQIMKVGVYRIFQHEGIARRETLY